MKRYRWRVAAMLVLLGFWMAGSGIQAEEPRRRNTLENQAILSGTADPDTQIECTVYTYDNRQSKTLLYQMEYMTGESGVYQLTIPLPILGHQYVMVKVGESETVYEYIRYRKQLAQDLKGYYLNIYQVLQEDSQ